MSIGCGEQVREQGQVCVGILILVSEPLAGRVRALRHAVSHAPQTGVPTHVTLVPPTSVPEAMLPAVVEHVRAVAAQHAPFGLRVAGTGTFQPVTDVVYLRVVDGGESCERLQSDLRSGPLATTLRYPYHPHVTLAHDVPQSGLDLARQRMADVDERFGVAEFVLFVDRDGDSWERLESFALGG